MLCLFVFNPRKTRAVVFTLPCAMSRSLSKEGVGQQCPKGKCGRNEGGQLEARGMGQGCSWCREHCDGPRAVQEDRG